MTEQTVEITRRSRNLGYAWSNHPEQRRTNAGHSYLVVAAPAAPAVEGGLRTVLAERDRAARINSSNDWSESLFVGGRRVVAVDVYGDGTFVEQNVVYHALEAIDAHGAQAADPILRDHRPESVRVRLA